MLVVRFRGPRFLDASPAALLACTLRAGHKHIDDGEREMDSPKYCGTDDRSSSNSKQACGAAPDSDRAFPLRAHHREIGSPFLHRYLHYELNCALPGVRALLLCRCAARKGTTREHYSSGSHDY